MLYVYGCFGEINYMMMMIIHFIKPKWHHSNTHKIIQKYINIIHEI